MAEKEFEEKTELTPIINTDKPQTKSRSANDTPQYFTGIDVQSNGSTILSADVIDTEARTQISDLTDYVGYLSYLDGFNYKFDSSTTPKIINGRFLTNHNYSNGIVPIDINKEIIETDYSKNWEIGIAFMFNGSVTQDTPIYGNRNGAWNSPPYIIVGGTNLNTARVRVFDTSGDAWELNPILDTESQLQENKWYFIKVAYDAETATVTASTTSDFINWTTETLTREGKTPKSSNQSAFAEFKSSYTMNEYCIIDFANTYIKHSNVMVWGHFDGKFAGDFNKYRYVKDYQLPDEYNELEYIICPSQSAQAGFSFSFSTNIPRSTIIDFTAALLASQSGEIAFGGSSSGNSWELYFESMQGKTYGAIEDINGFKKDIQLDTPYRAIAISTNPLDKINIGYYRLNQYIFKGKIYHAKVYNYWGNGVGDSENVICEFIPAKRKSDNKIGMYERVNGVFYSSTTGTEFEAPST